MKRPSMRGLARDLAELEATDPDVALAADELDRVTRQITRLPGGPLKPSLRDRNRADVAHAAAQKRKREAEAEAWIAEVRARPKR